MTLQLVRAPAPDCGPRDVVVVCAKAAPEIGGIAATLDAVVDDDMVGIGAIDLAPSYREGFAGFSHRALWPLFHGFRNRIQYRDGEWEAYDRANTAYARHALERANLGATVWIHDYELLLAGMALRRLGHRGPLGHFLHVPFPASDLFATLPWRTQVLEAMLANDLLAFQTRQSADNFLATVRSLRGATIVGDVVHYRHRDTHVHVSPNTIDPKLYSVSDADTPEVTGLREQLEPHRVLLGVDRLDYAKGILERLAAYERFLERYPQWQRKTVLLQVCPVSRLDIPDYVDLRHRVERLVGRINGRFGEADWVPVCYLARSYSRAALVQLYRLADVALVTPLRDGMNLVAKEFVAAQDPARPGVLVLSRFAGAAEQMIAALLTNPFHCEGLAADIDRALQMPLDERRQRQHSLRRVLAEAGTPATWAHGMLGQLRAIHSARRNRSTT